MLPTLSFGVPRSTLATPHTQLGCATLSHCNSPHSASVCHAQPLKLPTLSFGVPRSTLATPHSLLRCATLNPCNSLHSAWVCHAQPLQLPTLSFGVPRSAIATPHTQLRCATLNPCNSPYSASVCHAQPLQLPTLSLGVPRSTIATTHPQLGCATLNHCNFPHSPECLRPPKPDLIKNPSACLYLIAALLRHWPGSASVLPAPKNRTNSLTPNQAPPCIVPRYTESLSSSQPKPPTPQACSPGGVLAPQ